MQKDTNERYCFLICICGCLLYNKEQTRSLKFTKPVPPVACRRVTELQKHLVLQDFFLMPPSLLCLQTASQQLSSGVKCMFGKVSKMCCTTRLTVQLDFLVFVFGSLETQSVTFDHIKCIDVNTLFS